MVKQPFACGECHQILEDVDCPQHPGAVTTKDWTGYVVVTDPDRSDIADRLNIRRPGAYALKVSIR